MIKKIFEKKEAIYWILGIMILLQLSFIVYCFQFRKEGVNSDEMWTYGFANSYYQRDFFRDNLGNPARINEWVDGKTIKDYLVVNKGEEFTFDSVYANQALDFSPPFHSMILHAICSFFPESYSRWYAFVINIVAFLLTQIFFFKSVALLENEKVALLCTLFFGFSRAGVDDFLYLRMYALCTAFVMIILFLALKSVITPDLKGYWKIALPLFVISYLSFMTHYYMVSFAGILTAIFCIYLLFAKEIKRMFQFGFTMLFAFLLSVFSYPTLLMVAKGQTEDAAVGMNENAVFTSLGYRLITLLGYTTGKLFGFVIDRTFLNNAKNILILFALLLFVSLPLLILILMKKIKAAKANNLPVADLFKNWSMGLGKFLKRGLSKKHILFYLIIASFALQYVAVSETSRVVEMGAYVDRYTFNVLPLLIFITVYGFYLLMCAFVKNNKLVYCVVLAGVIFLSVKGVVGQLDTSDYFFEREGEGEAIRDLSVGKKIVYLEDGDWIMQAMCESLYECDSLFRMDLFDYDKYDDLLVEKLAGEKEWYLLVGSTFHEENLISSFEAGNFVYNEAAEELRRKKEQKYKDIVAHFETLLPGTTLEKVAAEKVFSRRIVTYKISAK